MVWQIESDDPDIQRLDKFGLYSINIPQAIDFIVKSFITHGEIDLEIPDKLHYKTFNKEFSEKIAHLKPEYEKYIIDAIKNERLKANIFYDIKGDYVLDRTYVDIYDLLEWVDKSDIEIGEAFDEMQSKFHNIELKVISTILLEKTKYFDENQDDLITRLNINNPDKFSKIYMDNIRITKEMENLKNNNSVPISAKQKENLHIIIGSLLGLLLGKSSSGKPYSQFNSQQSIIDAIQGNYGDARSLSKKNLEEKFATAKRIFESHVNIENDK